MKFKKTTRKRILISSLLVGILLLGAIISIVAVLAANLQNVASNIKISYLVDGVAAKVSATYATVPNEGAIVKTLMSGTTSGEEEIEFGVADSEKIEQMNPVEITLTTSERKIVYEYKFTNLASSPFTITLVEAPTVQNMNLRYFVSSTELDSEAYRNDFDLNKLEVQQMVEKNRTLYIYVSVEIEDAFESATYEGDMKWALIKADSDTVRSITLDNQNGTDSKQMNIIVTSLGIPMPMIYDLPTKENCLFEGYFTAPNGEGVKYINSDGSSARVADLADGDVLYASFSELPYVLSADGTTITGMTTTGQTATSIIIPDTVTTIANDAFSGSEYLESVTIPASVETIGDCAFENCANLQTVIFEGNSTQTMAYADASNLTSIGQKAFKGCFDLKELIIPEGVTEIKSETFVNCQSLQSLVFPTTMTTIASLSLEGCDSLQTLECNSDALTPENVQLSGYEDSVTLSLSGLARLFSYDYDSYIDLPDDDEYYYEYVLIPSKIPNSLKTIKFNSGNNIHNYTFDGCSLDNVILADTIQTIRYYAFRNSVLDELVIPASVTTINSDSLPESLKKLTLNCENLTSANTAFRNLVNLIELNWNVKNCNNFTDTSAPFKNAGTSDSGIAVNIGSNVERIPNYLFYGSKSATDSTVVPKITSINFEEGVKEIGDSAFRGLYSVDEIYLPDSLEVLKANAFKSATAKTIRLGKNLKTIGTVSGSSGQVFGWMAHLSNIIYDCENLGTIVGTQNFASISTSVSNLAVKIGPNVKEINTKILANCSGSYAYKLKSIDFSEAINLKIIVSEAFANHTYITEVILSENIEYVDVDAFKGCTQISLLSTYNNGTYMSNGSNAHYFLTGVVDSTVSSFTIADDCKVISKDALSSLTNISSINIPESIEVIYDGAFKGLTNLTTLTLPSNLRVIGAQAFYGLTNITTLTIPANVKSIGKKAFAEMTGLQTINYNAVKANDLTSTEMPFYVSTMNHNVVVNIGLGVVNIPAYLFYCGDKAKTIPIRTLSISNTVKYIGAYSFRYSTITELTIPNSVEFVGELAFKGAKAVEIFTLGQNVKTIEKEAFAYMEGVVTFNYNAKNIISCDSTVFDNMGGQTATTSSDTKTCKIIFGASVQKLPDNMFKGRTERRIASLDFSNATSLKEIGVSAFENATFSLITSFVIPNTVEKVCAKAFKGSKFENLTVGNNVNYIDRLAFSGMSNLKNVYYNATKAFVPSYSGETIFQSSGNSETGFAAVIANTVLELPDRLFHTTRVRTIDFKNTTVLTKLGDFSIYSNKLLESLVIPESVTYIGRCALSMNTKITSLNIPKNVSYIGLTNTQFLDSLTSLTVDSANQTYYSSGNCIIERATKTIIAGCNVSVIPQNEGILAIGECAFCRSSKLTSVTIPSTVTTIGFGAFEYCYSLSSVVVPASVTKIGAVAFNYCVNLTSLTVDSANKVYYSQNNCIIEKATKKLIQAINTSIIPDDIKHFGDRALANIYNNAGQENYASFTVQDIIITETIETIASTAFTGSSHTTVFINNKSVAMGLTSSQASGGLISSKVKTVYIASGLKVTNFIKSNFTLAETIEVDGVSYLKYTR